MDSVGMEARMIGKTVGREKGQGYRTVNFTGGVVNNTRSGSFHL